MDMKTAQERQSRYKFLMRYKLSFWVPVFYVAAVVLVIVFSLQYEKSLHKRGVNHSSLLYNPLYIDLTESPAYIKRGFNSLEFLPENFPRLAEELRSANLNLANLKFAEPPAQTGSEFLPSQWARFEFPPPLLVMQSPLPDLPPRRFLSRRGNEVQEFTILIPLELDSETLPYMPGIYLASIGDNWEIYLIWKVSAFGNAP